MAASIVDDALADLLLDLSELEVEVIHVWVQSKSPTLTLELASAHPRAAALILSFEVDDTERVCADETNGRKHDSAKP